LAKYIILDTETTGASESDKIIQLGYIVLDAKDIEVHNEFCSTDVPISYGAMEVHHITPELIEGKPLCVDTMAYQRLEALNTPDNYMIIHNAPFDLGMLSKEGYENKMQLIDTLRCAKHAFADEDAHRLQYFRYKMGLYKDEPKESEKLGVEVKAHDAIGDVITLKLFLSKLRERVQENYAGNPVDKMVELTKTPVLMKKIRFGKHKGKELADVALEDAGYLRWMLDSMKDMDEDLRFSINHYLGT